MRSPRNQSEYASGDKYSFALRTSGGSTGNSQRSCCSWRQLLAGLLPDDVLGVPVRPFLLVFAAAARRSAVASSACTQRAAFQNRLALRTERASERRAERLRLFHGVRIMLIHSPTQAYFGGTKKMLGLA